LSIAPRLCDPKAEFFNAMPSKILTIPFILYMYIPKRAKQDGGKGFSITKLAADEDDGNYR